MPFYYYYFQMLFLSRATCFKLLVMVLEQGLWGHRLLRREAGMGAFRARGMCMGGAGCFQSA